MIKAKYWQQVIYYYVSVLFAIVPKTKFIDFVQMDNFITGLDSYIHKYQEDG